MHISKRINPKSTNKLKLMIASVLLTFFTYGVFAQSDSKEASIISSGSGETLEDAKQAALRSATEQAFGVFISSKTEIFNDQIVADQMASVSSGNIKSYEVLNQSQLPNGSWGVTLKSIVSVDKLASFVEAKGFAVEIKGGLFALNIKQQLLNEQGEIKAISEMVGLLHEPMQISFDYKIQSLDPKSLDAESKNWEIPLVVTANANKNMDFCANYFIKTLEAISLTSKEADNYLNLNKQVWKIKVKYNGIQKEYYLRKYRSIYAIETLLDQWEFYTGLFTVQSGLDESNENGKGNLVKFELDKSYGHELNINFLTAGLKAATFSWQDIRTLSEIEQMTGYTVKPRGVVSQYKHGGFVVHEENGQGLIAAITDLGEMSWYAAMTACQELILNGYSDWYLPSIIELNSIYEKLAKRRIASLNIGDRYWSSEKEEKREMYDDRENFMYVYQLSAGEDSQYPNRSDMPNKVRCVRTF